MINRIQDNLSFRSQVRMSPNTAMEIGTLPKKIRNALLNDIYDLKENVSDEIVTINFFTKQIKSSLADKVIKMNILQRKGENYQVSNWVKKVIKYDSPEYNEPLDIPGLYNEAISTLKPAGESNQFMYFV